MVNQLLDLLGPAERRRARLLMGMILVMAFLDMRGVASILPFVAVLANPGLVETNRFLGAAFEVARALGVESRQDFLLALGVVVFLVFIASLAFKSLTIYVQTRFALMRENSIGKRLVERYLHQPYSWFLNRNSADLGKTILSEVGAVIGGSLIPLMNLISQIAVALALLILLVIVDPLLALSVCMLLVPAYAGIFAFMNGWLKRLSHERIKVNKERFTAVSEAFSAAKAVKVGGLEAV